MEVFFKDSSLLREPKYVSAREGPSSWLFLC